MANEVELSFTFIETDDATHVYLSHEPFHDTETFECWCQPWIIAACECSDGCWRCGGKGFPLGEQVTPAEARLETRRLVVQHRC